MERGRPIADTIREMCSLDLVLYFINKCGQGEGGVINPVNFADVLYVWSLSFPVIPLKK